MKNEKGKYIAQDLTGQKFGLLTAIEKTNYRCSNGSVKWLCICDCGNKKNISASKLSGGETISCGCAITEAAKKRRGVRTGREKDITGIRFNHLIAIKRVDKPEDHLSYGTYWLFKCDCGNEIIGMKKTVSNGGMQHCGCLAGVKRIIGLEGRKYGRLNVIERIGLIKDRQSYRCLCDCGNEHIVTGHDLTGGNTRSCGCYFNDVSNHIGGNTARNKKYGDYRLRADKIGVNFTLTIDQFEKLMTDKCFYCGSEPKQTTIRGKIKKDIFIHNGIDRIDSNEGYTINNSVTCCKICNVMKLSMSQPEFKRHIKKVYKHFVLDKKVRNENLGINSNSISELLLLKDNSSGE